MGLIGYARVSTADQDTALQTDALRKAGCERVFEDTVSGVKADRPGLAAALAYLRDGDVLAVWRLDRLGRSLPHLIEAIGAGYLGDLTGGVFGSQYVEIFAFLVLILVLTLRPSGLMGERVADRA